MTRRLAASLAWAYAKYYLPVATLVAVIVFVAVRDSHAWYVGLVALSLAATITIFAFGFELARRREFETLQSFGVSFGAAAAVVACVSLVPQVLAGAFTVSIARDAARASLYALAALIGTAAPMAIVLFRCWKRPNESIVTTVVLGFCAWGVAAAAAMYAIARI